MSSVQGVERCPKCGGNMFVDYCYRTGEGSAFCQRCGSSKSLTFERDENGLAILDESGNPTENYSEYGGYGVACIEDGESRIGGFYPLSEPLSEREKEDFLRFVKENGAEKGSYLVTFDPNTGKLAQVFGKIPPDFDGM